MDLILFTIRDLSGPICKLTRGHITVQMHTAPFQRLSALLTACAQGEAEVAAYLDTALVLVSELGANVNAKDSTGETPLHVAAEMDHHELVRVLVRSHGADVHAKDDNDRTPLCFAEENGHHETARVLVKELGALRNGRPKNRRKCLPQ